MSAPPFLEVPPQTAGLERLDLRDDDLVGDWSRVRDLVQSDLAVLDSVILAQCQTARARPGSNRGGRTCLFVYRVFDAGSGTDIDPVVVGINVTAALPPGDSFRISGDVAGEALGDVLFELPPRDVVGWEPMIDAARDAAESLARQADRVLAALGDHARRA